MPSPSVPQPPPSPAVALARCATYDRGALEAAVRAVLEPLGGMAAFVKPGQRVLLKPNLILPRPADSGVVTHPEFVRAVALEALNAGGKVVIGDSPAFGSARSVAAQCGLAAVARELGVEIIDLGRSARATALGADSPFKTAGLSADALDAEVLINLPKIKTHGQLGMSLTTKNLFGCVAGKRKALFHFRAPEDPYVFGRLVVAIARALRPALSIADGIVLLERDGPARGDARPGHFIAAGTDTVALDHVILKILGVSPDDVPYLTAARDMGYGRPDPREERVLGESIAALKIADYKTIEESVPIHFTFTRVIRSILRHLSLRLKEKRARR